MYNIIIPTQTNTHNAFITVNINSNTSDLSIRKILSYSGSVNIHFAINNIKS